MLAQPMDQGTNFPDVIVRSSSIQVLQKCCHQFARDPTSCRLDEEVEEDQQHRRSSRPEL